MPYISHKLGKTYYTTRGRQTRKAPFIFLHGGPGGQHGKDSPIIELSNERKVYQYDQIGGGKSSPIKKSQMKIETFVWELKFLVNHWGLEKFHLGGGSWGTTLALEYYLRTGDKRIQSLTFQSPMFDAKIWEQDCQQLISKMSKSDQKILNYCHEIGAMDAEVYKQASFRFYLKHVCRNKAKLVKALSGISESGDDVYNYMWGPTEFKPTGTLAKYSRRKDLSKIKVPTLFVCGQYDEATPGSTKKFSQKVRGSQFKVIPKASHAILAERPRQLLKVVRGFLSDQESGTAHG